MSIENAKWYVLHTYSGYENMVKENLVLVFKKNDMIDRLFEVVVPMEDVVEEKNGKTKIVQRRLMPSYVFVKMDYNNDMWHMVTNTRGVTGFVGPQGRPLPLTDDEVKRMHLERPTTVITDFEIGETVKIIDGSFEGFIGTIDSIDIPKEKCKVTVSMFGRLTPVELDLAQIERPTTIGEEN
ncbi:MAG: transcription termination/antitermination factor NusG [Clostridia bacterium]|nr:transcription termination/antitermination factor NusG [Clostridia bacterium]